MNAAPLLEAVRHAGGTVTVSGNKLRLSAPEPLPDQLLEELRQHRSEILDLLSRNEQLVPHRDRTDELKVPTPTIETWAEGIARLRTKLPPRDYPMSAWQQLLRDAERFLERWGPQAVALGWQDWELFGCCRFAPWGRIEGMGLVLLLRGNEVVALTDSEAVIRTVRGARQTHPRKPYDPLLPAERCLVWGLGDATS
jgi:hypothetical protein